MFEEFTTPDLVEGTRRACEALSGRDLDTLLSFFAPDAVLDMSHAGLGSYEGHAAIRGIFEDWIGAYEKFEFEPVQILDLGKGVVFGVAHQSGRPLGSTGYVHMHQGNVFVWVAGLLVRVTHYNDIDEARAAAERLAEERE